MRLNSKTILLPVILQVAKRFFLWSSAKLKKPLHYVTIKVTFKLYQRVI